MAREMKDSGIEWIGEIPVNWSTTKLALGLHILSGFPFDSAKFSLEKGVPLIRIRDITSGVSETKYDGDYSSEYVIKNGDTLIAMDGDFTVREWHGGEAVLNQRCCKVYSDTFENRFVYYCLPLALKLINDLTYATTVKHLSVNDIKGIKIPIPFNSSDQHRIASFLDSKCAEIDKAIDATKASIEEYRKLRQAIITEAVTKGLNPDVEMKDSGIEWIGEIPKHWDVTKIGKSFSLRDEKNYKSEDETQLLSLYTGRGVFPTGDEGTINSGNHAQTVIGYKVVKKDDIVVNIILAWMGAIGISEYDGVVSPAYDVYIPNKNIVCPRFCHYLFRTTGIANECYRYGRGIMMMRWRTYSTEFKQIRIPLPPIREQMKIASYLDTKCSEIDSLIKSKEKLIEELTAYRKSLIYEYVTGKKEVPAV